MAAEEFSEPFPQFDARGDLPLGDGTERPVRNDPVEVSTRGVERICFCLRSCYICYGHQKIGENDSWIVGFWGLTYTASVC